MSFRISVVGKNKQWRLEKAGETRWWTKEKVLNSIFGFPTYSFNDYLYTNIVIALNKMKIF